MPGISFHFLLLRKKEKESQVNLRNDKRTLMIEEPNVINELRKIKNVSFKFTLFFKDRSPVGSENMEM